MNDRYLARLTTLRQAVVVFLLSASLGLIMGCSGQAELDSGPPEEHGTYSGYATYSKYGFSFQYPGHLDTTEVALLARAANEYSGVVMIGERGGETILEVTWVKNADRDLESAIETGFAILESKDRITDVHRGELLEIDHNGHRMLVQGYTVTSATGESLCGVGGVLWCDHSANFYSVVTLRKDLADEQAALGEFRDFLSTFVCH